VLASASDLLWPLRTVSAKMPKLVSPDLKDYTHVAAKRPRRRRPLKTVIRRVAIIPHHSPTFFRRRARKPLQMAA
jgi:hypothetical protein